jgi:hypothetical protein
MADHATSDQQPCGQLRDRRISPRRRSSSRLATSILKRSPREEITELAWQDSTADLSKHYSLCRVPSTSRSHTRDKRLQPNGYAFQLRPPERGGHTNKGNNHNLSIHDGPAAQHGQRPRADRRQRQLQTLVRQPGPAATAPHYLPLVLASNGLRRPQSQTAYSKYGQA